MNAADTFNRADATLHGATASDGANTWTVQAGTFSVTSNQAMCATSGSADIATVNPGCADADVAATLTAVTSSGYGIVARWSDASNYVFADLSSSTARVRKREAGTTSTVASASASGASGDRLRLNLVGNQVTLYRTPSGGSEALAIAAQTIALNTSATRHGLFDSFLSSRSWEDFAVADLGVAAARHHLAMLGVGS